jgi:Family of unknown function (DUF6088)
LKKDKEEGMSTSAFIKRHIFKLLPRVIFSTRDMLNYGPRAAVDQCLYRLVKSGRIIRLAWGLFMKEEYDGPLPTILEVAKAKAGAFGRKIISDAADAAKRLELTNVANGRTTYAINSGSSSFRYNHQVIHFKGISARKLFLGDELVGQSIRALWSVGKADCDEEMVSMAMARFSRPERKQFRQSLHLMPSWMTDLLFGWGS